MTAQPDFLLSVYLRGGADGLTFISPYAEVKYMERINTRMYAPTHTGPEPKVLPFAVPPGLPTSFGIHPALAPLNDLYLEGRASFIHATGSTDSTRSHFNQMFFTETGTTSASSATDPTGLWNRYMTACPNPSAATSRALSLTKVNADYFLQSPVTTPVPNPEAYVFPAEKFASLSVSQQAQFAAEREQVLTTLYTNAGAPTSDPFAAMLATIETVDTSIDPAYTPPAGVGSYSPSSFGTALKHAAQFARAGVGPDIVHVDSGGWDTHQSQGVAPGIDGGGMHFRMADLAENLKVFLDDTDGIPREVTVLVITEFGRSVDENESFGTDHARGGVAIALGSGLNKLAVGVSGSGQTIERGKFVVDWPGFDPAVEAGDLDVTIDIRDIQAELLLKRMGLPMSSFASVFNTVDFTASSYVDRGLFDLKV